MWCSAAPISLPPVSSAGPPLEDTVGRYVAAIRAGQQPLWRVWLDGIIPVCDANPGETRWVLPALRQATQQYLGELSAQAVPAGLTADSGLESALRRIIRSPDQLLARPDPFSVTDVADLWKMSPGGSPYGPVFPALVNAERAIGGGPPRVTGLAPAETPRGGGLVVAV